MSRSQTIFELQAIKGRVDALRLMYKLIFNSARMSIDPSSVINFHSLWLITPLERIIQFKYEGQSLSPFRARKK